MNGAFIVIAFVVAVAAGVVHHAGRNKEEDKRTRGERLAAFMAGLATLSLLIGAAAQVAVLWQFGGTMAGLCVLAVLLMLAGYLGHKMLLKGEGHHVQGSYVVSVVGCGAVGFTVGGWPVLLASVMNLLDNAGSGAGSFISGKTATAAIAHAHATSHAAHGGSSANGWIVFLTVAALGAGLLLFWRSHRRHNGGGDGRPAIGGGGRPIPSGR